MSTDPLRLANLAAIECERRPQLPDGFRRASTRVAAALGAVRTGLSVYELPPGQAVSPYHYEEPEEEWLLVVSGTPTLRHPNGEEHLEPWDIVFFPAGPAGATGPTGPTGPPGTGNVVYSVGPPGGPSGVTGAVSFPAGPTAVTWTLKKQKHRQEKHK